jgi:general stress protein YciG
MQRKGAELMAGTLEGGRKAAATNKAKYGKDFYRNLGRIGGHNGHSGGFASNPELAKLAGAKGGKISRRGKAKSTPAKSEAARLKRITKIEEKIDEFYKRLYEINKPEEEWNDYESTQ